MTQWRCGLTCCVHHPLVVWLWPEVVPDTLAEEGRWRMTLGTDTDRVVSMVLGESLVVVGVGTAIGLAASIAVTRVLQSLLFAVDPVDPLTLTLVTALLLGVAALASLLPARRAAGVDPMEALRSE